MHKAKSGKHAVVPQTIAGNGKFLFQDESEYEGDYVETMGQEGGPKEPRVEETKVREGQGIYRSKLGIYEGAWSADNMHGAGKFTFYKGNGIVEIFDGQFDNNKFLQGRYTFADGSYYEGSFKDNRMDGPGVYFDQYGAEWKGKFVDGAYDSLPAAMTNIPSDEGLLNHAQ